MSDKLVEEIEARIEFIKLALKHCGKCEDETCSACGFYETELGILKRCLESLRWIPVSEEMPKDMVHVLLYRANEDYAVPGFLCGHHFFALTADIGKSWHSGVTHWMPLPAIPQ